MTQKKAMAFRVKGSFWEKLDRIPQYGYYGPTARESVASTRQSFFLKKGSPHLIKTSQRASAGFERSEGAKVVKKRSSGPQKIQADKNYIEVMGKIFAVLEYFVEHGSAQRSIAFAELARSLPFARSTIHRILYSLEKLGYVQRDDIKSRYELAAKFFELTGSANHFRRLQSVSKSVMQHLLLRFGETINLGVLEDNQVTYIDVLQSPSALRIAAVPGERNPVHCTALGKAMLAFLPESEVDRILENGPLIRRTPKTITQKRHLLEHLASVRERAVALDMEENVSGVICVGAPIFDQKGSVVAGISVSGPATRMLPKLTQVQDEIRNSALGLSRMLSPSALAAAVLSNYRRAGSGPAPSS
jgi:IclR family transcriptional regulator, KDG regulon repressor